MKRHTVFISYSWDSPAHKEWVRRLASRLQSFRDVKVIFDQFHTWAGVDLARFMETGLRADRIVTVLTPAYARKASQRRGGVGYESTIITGQIFRRFHKDRFIPVLRGDPVSSVPAYLSTRSYVDMRDHAYFETGVADIIRALRRDGANVSQRRTPAQPRTIRGFGRSDWLRIPQLPGYGWYIRNYRLAFEPNSVLLDHGDDFWFAYEPEFSNSPITFAVREKKLHRAAVGVEIALDSTSTQEPPRLKNVRVEVLVRPVRAVPIVESNTFREFAGDAWRLTTLRTDDAAKKAMSLLLGPRKKDPRLPLMRFAIVSPASAPVKAGDDKILIEATLHFEGGAGLSHQWRI